MKQTLTSLFLLLTVSLFAQPANDDCGGIAHLGDAPSCDSTLYNNVGATESDIGFDNFPGCFIGVPDRDVWFSFTAVDTIDDYRIQLVGCSDPGQNLGSISNPQIAVYRGDCEVDGMQLLDCISADAGETSVDLDLLGLTPGITYLVRINDWSSSASPNDGAFKLCVIKKPPVNTVDDNGSTECFGILTDTGGENGDYSNNENFTYTICPTAPHNCILFDLTYYNLELTGDVLTFFDGPNTNAPQIGQITGTAPVISAPPENNGGVCYSVSASSGCLTVQFQSDASMVFEGFEGTWQCTAGECPEAAEMVIDTDATQEEIVQSVVSGQTLISIAEVNCNFGAVGTFAITDDTDLSMDKGLVLSTGRVLDIPLPASSFANNGFGTAGDDDLDILSAKFGNGILSNDACIVEMDVLAASNEITFEYVFGSEEYPEFIDINPGEGDGFNDIFAFLVSGPGIVGDPDIGNQLNVATLPDGTFIEINTVNSSINWPFYRDNSLSQAIAYDGLTSDTLGIKKSLTARVPTIPCETYKLKFAIADRGDTGFDSGVFISKINSGTPEIFVNFQSGVDYLVEDCNAVADEVTITFGNQLEGSQTYNVVIGGNAEMGVDYELVIPSTITFETGTEIFTFPIVVLTDDIFEGIDSIELQLTRDFGCGTTVVSSIIIEIHDNLQVEILTSRPDTAIICLDAGCIFIEAEGATEFAWAPDTLFSDSNIAMPEICSDEDLWITVTGTLGTCSDIDSIYIDVKDVQVVIQPDTNMITACSGDVIELFAENTVNDVGLVWNSFNQIDDPTNPNQSFTDTGFGFDFVNVQVEEGGCIATDGITLNYLAHDLPQLTNDTVICQNFSVDLGEDIESNTTNFQWTPDVDLSPSAEVSGPVVTPQQTTTYTLIANSGDGLCIDTLSVTVEVIPADVEIQNPDTTLVCVGDSVTLTSANTTNGIGVTWSPLIFMDVISPQEALVYPPVSTWYYNTLVTSDCTVTDSVYVRIDSLPALEIIADPAKESYCQGEEILLMSPTYEPSHFPGIEFMWQTPMPGAQTPDSFLNLVIIAAETATYFRTDSIGACVSFDSIHIEVTPVTMISVVPEIDTICQGESVAFTVNGPPELENFMWMPEDGLSCTDCRSPIAMPFGTITYQVSAEFEGCPVGASTTLIVPNTMFIPPTNTFICPGEQVFLNQAASPGATYQWTASDGSSVPAVAQPVVAPLQTTTYTITATLGDCTLTDEVTIMVAEDFNLSIAPVDASCPGDPISLAAVIDPPIQEVAFSWTNSASADVFTGQTVSPSPSPVATETWTVVAVSDNGCFTHSADIEVEVAPEFTILVSPPIDSILAGQTSTFNAEATTAGIEFTWTEVPGGAQVGTGPTLSVVNCEDQSYQVSGTDFNGCEQSAIAQVIVTESFSVLTPVVLGPSGDTLIFNDPTQTDTLIYEGQEVQIASATSPPLPNATYIWVLNGDTISVTTSPTSGLFNLPEVDADLASTFELIVINSDGCDGISTFEAVILNNPVVIPNVFTPNGDEFNQNFTLVSKRPVNILQFQIWNRWGKLIYDNENGNAGWTGEIDGKAAASDVYIYNIVYEIMGSNNPMPPMKGDVTLLR